MNAAKTRIRGFVGALLACGLLAGVPLGLQAQEKPRPKQPRRARAFLGVGTDDGPANGIEITSITPKSAAEKAGLKPGDILHAVGKQAVTTTRALRQALAKLRAGDKVELTITRKGKRQTLEATLGARPKSSREPLKSSSDPKEGQATARYDEDDYQRLPIPFDAKKLPRAMLEPLAKQAGEAILWVTTLDKARALARATGRPIFWYFQKSPFSPTYEPEDYDYYLRTTLFHYPATVALINRKFIPLKLTPTREQATRLGLQRFKFVEPGFVIVTHEGERLHTVDRIATYHEDFFYYTLARLLADNPKLDHDSPQLASAQRAADKRRTTANRLALCEAQLDDGKLEAAYAGARLLVENRTRKLADAALAVMIRAAARARNDAWRQVADAYLTTLRQRGNLPKTVMLALFERSRIGRRGPFNRADFKEALARERKFVARAGAPGLLWAAELHWRAKDEAGARDRWKTIVTKYPKTPEAAQAAVHLLGWSALVHNMIGPARLPERVYTRLPDNSGLPRQAADLTKVVRASLTALTQYQLSNGSFNDSPYDFMGAKNRPNTIYAITAIGAKALIDWQDALPPVTTAMPDPLPKAMATALERADAFLADHRNFGPTAIEKVYGYTYGLLYLLAKHARSEPGATQTAVGKRVARMIDKLAQVQGKTGAWGHEYPNPFVTGQVLFGLGLAKRAGFSVPTPALVAGAKILKSARAGGTYPYYFGRAAALPTGAGRTPLCELGLFMCGASDEPRLVAAIETFFAHVENLERVRQYDYHSDKYANGGFFFWHDFVPVADALPLVKDATRREAFRTKLRDRVLSYAEADGTFIDSQNIGRAYGTAMATSLLKVLHDLAPKAPDTPEAPQTPGPGR